MWCCWWKVGGRASGAGSFERGSRGRVGGRPPAPPGQHTQVRNRGAGAKKGSLRVAGKGAKVFKGGGDGRVAKVGSESNC